MNTEELDEIKTSNEDELLEEEPLEEQEFEGEEGDAEEDDDGEVYQLEVEDDEGNPVVENYTAKQLRQIVSGYKKNRSSERDEELLAQVKPFLDRVNQSSLLQWIHYYQDRGLNDEQVLQQLWKEMSNRGMSNTQEQEEDEPVDKDGYDYIKKKVYEEQVRPLQAELEAIKQQQMQTYIHQNNTMAFSQALKAHGWDESRLNQDQVDRVYATLRKAYPGLNVQNYGLTQDQANLVIRSALGYRKNPKNKQQANPANLTKQASAPRLLGGSAGKGQSGQTTAPNLDNLSLSQRINLKKKLFS